MFSNSNSASWMLKISLGIVLMATCFALFISYKAGIAPWAFAWFENGGLSSRVKDIVATDYHQLIILGVVGLNGLWFWLRSDKEPMTQSIYAASSKDESAEQSDGSVSSVKKATDPDTQVASSDEQNNSSTTASKYEVNSGYVVANKSNTKFEAASAEIARLNAELEETKEQLNFVKESKTILMSNISHEIRTPLNGIIGMTELLGNTGLLEPESRYVRSISSSADSLSNIIDDILNMARIESGNLLLENNRYDLRNCVNSICESQTFAAHAKNIELICYIDDEIPQFVIGDAFHLRQILNKLITNAIIHTETGEVVVRLTALPQTEHGKHHFQCDVQDTGVGMLPEVQMTLYEVFSQAESASARRHGGTGMGLSMVQELVSMFEGVISVKSRVNEGTRFTFTLKQGAAAQNLDIGSNKSSGANNAQIAFERDDSIALAPISAHVLLAEDNLVNQDAAREMLTHMGCRVVVVGNGLEAVRQAEAEKFDVVFMNCNMPVMDGFEALHQIREGNSLNKTTPIIALTANAMEGDREKCLELGMSEYLSKPVRQKHLHGLLSAWVQDVETNDLSEKEGVMLGKHPALNANSQVGERSDEAKASADETNAGGNVAAAQQSSVQSQSDSLPAEESEPVINMKAIDTIRSLQRPGKPDLLNKVAHLFLDKTPDTIVEMQEALSNGDTDVIKAHVHALKSSSAYLGADSLSDICRQIESNAGSNNIEAIGSLLDKFVTDYELVAQELTGILKAA